MKRIAVVDGEGAECGRLKKAFQAAAYSVKTFSSAGKYLDALAAFPPDLTVLDLHVPGVSGWDLIRIIRERSETRWMPLVICSTENRTAADIVRALSLGADEYLTKPVQWEIMLARIEALLRRTGWHAAEKDAGPERLTVANLTVDIAQHAVHLGREAVGLTPLEFDLLVYLVRNQSRVLTRGLLLEHVWKTDPSQSTRTVDKRIEALRRKLRAFGGRIETFSGVGYSLRC